MKWRIVLAIARKDIEDAIRNSHLLFALLLPIGLSLLFRVVFTPPEELGTLHITVYDQGNSRLVEQLRTLPQVRLVQVNSAEELSQQIAEGAVGGLALPAGFDAAVQAGKRPALDVLANERRGLMERMAFRWLVEQQLWTLGGYELPAQIATSVDTPEGPQPQTQLHLDRFLLIVVLVMALAMTGAYMLPTLLVEEKEKRTLQALLVSPASPGDIVIGKALTGLFYSVLMVGVLLVMNQGLAGNWAVTLAALLLGALFTVMVGLLMGGLFHTAAQVNTWSSIVMLALTVPSWFTILTVPAPLQAFLRLIPTHYMVGVLNRSLAGEASWMNSGLPLGVLAGSTVVVFIAVVWTVRRIDRTGT